MAAEERDSLALARAAVAEAREVLDAAEERARQAAPDFVPVPRTGIAAALDACDTYIAMRVYDVKCNATRMRIVTEAAVENVRLLFPDASRTLTPTDLERGIAYLERRLSRDWLLGPTTASEHIQHDGGRAEMARLAGG